MESIVIYQNAGPKKGSVIIKPPLAQAPIIQEEQRRFKSVSRSLFLTGILGILILFSPLIFTELKYRIGRLQGKYTAEAASKVGFGEVMQNSNIKIFEPVEATSSKPKTGFAEIIRLSDIKIFQPDDANFSIVIPKIGLNSKILPDVNPGDKNEYGETLKNGVAHAQGTYLPGQNGTVYLFAHSTDYIWNFAELNAVFYLLKELDVGDEINIFYQGKKCLYRVSDKKIVSASDLSYFKPNSGEEKVVLVTCWPPGTSWKRLLVISKPAYST